MHFGALLETIFEDFGLPLGVQREVKRVHKNNMEPLFRPFGAHGRPQDPARAPQTSILSDFGDFKPHFHGFQNIFCMDLASVGVLLSDGLGGSRA